MIRELYASSSWDIARQTTIDFCKEMRYAERPRDSHMAVSQFREGSDSGIGKFFYFSSWGIDATMVNISPSMEDRIEENKVGEVASEQTIPLILWISIPACKPEP